MSQGTPERQNDHVNIIFCPAPTDEMKQWNLSRIRSIAYKAAASPRILVLDIYLFHRHVGLLFAAEVKGLS